MAMNEEKSVLSKPTTGGIELSEKLVLLRTRTQDLESVKKLNCWASNINDVQVVRRMPNLEVCSLSINKITSLRDFAHCHKLQELYVRTNKIVELEDLHYLKNLRRLRSLWLSDNPCASRDNYRMTVLRALPKLQKLDNVAVTEEELTAATEEGDQLLVPDDFSMSSVFTDPGMSTDTSVDCPSESQKSTDMWAAPRKRRHRRREKASESQSSNGEEGSSGAKSGEDGGSKCSTDENSSNSPRDEEEADNNGAEKKSIDITSEGNTKSKDMGEEDDSDRTLGSGESLSLSGTGHMRKSDLRRMGSNESGDSTEKKNIKDIYESVERTKTSPKSSPSQSEEFTNKDCENLIIESMSEQDTDTGNVANNKSSISPPCNEERYDDVNDKNNNKDCDDKLIDDVAEANQSAETSLLDKIQFDSIDTVDQEEETHEEEEVCDSIDLADLELEFDPSKAAGKVLNTKGVYVSKVNSVTDKVNVDSQIMQENEKITKSSNATVPLSNNEVQTRPVKVEESSVRSSTSSKHPIDWEEYNRLRKEIGVKTIDKPISTSKSVNVETLRSKNSNILSAVLSLVRELDKDSLDIVAAAVKSRRESL